MKSSRFHWTRKRKIVYTSIVLVGFLVFCETVTRVRSFFRYGNDHSNTVNSILVYRKDLGIYIPRANSRLLGSKINIAINNHGFRGTDFSIKKASGVKRIVCVGASTTFCTEAQKPWPSCLEDFLKAACPDQIIEVINAGVPGYGIEHTLKNMQKRVIPLDPDVIVLYHANNDIIIDTKILAREKGIIASPNHMMARLQRKSLIFDLVVKNIRILTRGGGTKKLQQLPEHLTDRFVNVLGEINNLCRQNGIQLVLSTFQVKYRRDQPINIQIRNADVAFYYTPWMTIDLLHEALSLYNTSIEQFALQNQIALIDNAQMIPGDDEHFVDCMHFTDMGCQVMAQRIGQGLQDQGIIQSLLAHGLN